MNNPILGAVAHHAIATASITEVPSMTGLRPTVLDNGAEMGMKAVEVMRNEVESHDAEFEEWNSDVIIG